MRTSVRHASQAVANGEKRSRVRPRARKRLAKRALVYLRVSTLGQEKNGKNLDGQLDEVREYCQRKGYRFNDEDVFRDVVSGARTDRKGYYKLLSRVEKEDAEVIVAWNVSRLGRNSLDGAWLMVKAKEHGYRIETAQEGMDFTADPAGELVYDVLTAAAKFQRNTILQDMMRGKKTGHKNGHWVNASPPVGYEARGPRGGRVLYPTERAALVREVFEWYAGGVPAQQISDRLRARGEKASTGREGASFAPQVVGRMLDNPVYAGFISYKGELAKGAHEPIIAQDLWERVRALRAQARARYVGRPPKEEE